MYVPITKNSKIDCYSICINEANVGMTNTNFQIMFTCGKKWKMYFKKYFFKNAKTSIANSTCWHLLNLNER